MLPIEIVVQLFMLFQDNWTELRSSFEWARGIVRSVGSAPFTKQFF